MLQILSPIFWFPFLSPLWCSLAVPSPSSLQVQPPPPCSKSWNSSILSPCTSSLALCTVSPGDLANPYMFSHSVPVWVQSGDQSNVKKGKCSTKDCHLVKRLTSKRSQDSRRSRSSNFRKTAALARAEGELTRKELRNLEEGFPLHLGCFRSHWEGLVVRGTGILLGGTEACQRMLAAACAGGLLR